MKIYKKFLKGKIKEKNRILNYLLKAGLNVLRMMERLIGEKQLMKYTI